MTHNLTTILLVGHGSRTEAAIAEFNQFAADLAESIEQPVPCCFLELADPDMTTGLAQAAQQAGDDGQVVVAPVFLGAANHEKNDVASAVQWARGRFPSVAFCYGAPLGPHARLVELLDLRVAQALDAAPGALPAQETVVVVVGRGSSDPDSNSQVAGLAHLLSEQRPYYSVEYAFQAVAHPTVEEALRRCQVLGARQLVMAPYVLFTGRVYQDVVGVSARWSRQTGIPAVCASYLAPHALLLEVARQRLQEAIDGTAAMTCDLCKYRFPMAGYGDQVGQPQQTHHLHGGRHNRTHDHAPEHRPGR
jgi:sirohydrochlorin cobaltochelatase